MPARRRETESESCRYRITVFQPVRATRARVRNPCYVGGLPAVLAHVIAVPAAQNRFLPGVEIHALHALHVQIAEETLIPPAEAEQGDWRRHADVHAQHAALDFAHEFSRARAAGGEDTG